VVKNTVTIEDQNSVGSDSQKHARPLTGRKSAQESRSAEFRRQLILWKQTPGSLRPSLRALARELRTSHQLLAHYLDGLDKWQQEERYRNAMREMKETSDRAQAQGRLLTPLEQERMITCCREGMKATLCLKFERLNCEATRSPLDRKQDKMLRLFARHGFPGAQDLLQRCGTQRRGRR
jgi:hypothetical protein